MAKPGRSHFNQLGTHPFVPQTTKDIKTTHPMLSTSASDSQDSGRLVDEVTDKPANVFVAGSLAVDLACDFVNRAKSSSQSPELKTSNPGLIRQSLGGVGHNVARAAHLMGAQVRLLSAVGDDLAGKTAIQALTASRMSTQGIVTLGQDTGARTAQYVAINDAHKDLVLAMADMSILEDSSSETNALSNAFDDFWLPQLQKGRPSHLVVDANWPPEYLSRWFQAGKDINAHITFEPVSNTKSTSLFRLPPSSPLGVFPNPSVHLATPNEHELLAMYTAARTDGHFEREDWWAVIDALGIPSTGARTQLALATSSALVDQGIPQQTIQLLPFIPTICVKLGPAGVLLTQLLPAEDPRLSSREAAPHILSRCAYDEDLSRGVGGVYMRLFAPAERVRVEDVVSVNGVGDTFAGTLVAGLASQKTGIHGTHAVRVEDFIDVAQSAAVATLHSPESVSPALEKLRRFA